MPSHILRVILDYFTVFDYASHLGCGYHPIRLGHLPNRMGQIEPPLG
jgi:hypothetical protein